MLMVSLSSVCSGCAVVFTLLFCFCFVFCTISVTTGKSWMTGDRISIVYRAKTFEFFRSGKVGFVCSEWRGLSLSLDFSLSHSNSVELSIHSHLLSDVTDLLNFSLFFPWSLLLHLNTDPWLHTHTHPMFSCLVAFLCRRICHRISIPPSRSAESTNKCICV
jgi:hypothetical protein